MGTSMPEIRRPRPPYSSKEQKIAALYNHVDYDEHIKRLNKTVRSWDDPIIELPKIPEIPEIPEIPHADRTLTHWRRTEGRANIQPFKIEWLSDDARKAWNALEKFSRDRQKYAHELAKVAHELAKHTTKSRKELEKQKHTLEQLMQENIKTTDEYKKKLQSNRPDILEEHRQHRLAKKNNLSDRAKQNMKVHDNVTRRTRPRITQPKPRRKVSISAPK